VSFPEAAFLADALSFDLKFSFLTTKELSGQFPNAESASSLAFSTCWLLTEHNISKNKTKSMKSL